MVEIVNEVTEEVVEALARLVPQLSRSASPPDARTLEELIASGASTLLVARGDDGRIVGSLTLVVFRIPTGARARIEDVVVDESARGRGVGAELSRAALALARQHGARTVDLSSRPSREEANVLYRRLGFEPRETNVLRYEL